MRPDTAQHLDMFATIAAATGAQMPSDRVMDSFNLLGTGPRREITFWRSGDYRAVRAGDWKLQVSKRPDKMLSLEELTTTRSLTTLVPLEILMNKDDSASKRPRW